MLKRIPLFCQETGYSEKAVARKIEDGVWVAGREYVRELDGHQAMADAFTSGQINERVQCKT